MSAMYHIVLTLVYLTLAALPSPAYMSDGSVHYCQHHMAQAGPIKVKASSKWSDSYRGILAFKGQTWSSKKLRLDGDGHCANRLSRECPQTLHLTLNRPMRVKSIEFGSWDWKSTPTVYRVVGSTDGVEWVQILEVRRSSHAKTRQFHKIKLHTDKAFKELKLEILEINAMRKGYKRHYVTVKDL